MNLCSDPSPVRLVDALGVCQLEEIIIEQFYKLLFELLKFFQEK